MFTVNTVAGAFIGPINTMVVPWMQKCSQGEKETGDKFD